MNEVSVIGLGAMGSALAGGFLKRDHATTVWNRSAEKAGALVAKGAVRALTVAEAVAASKLVVVCVLNYATVYEALRPASDALSGRVLVNLTNGTPAHARNMAKWAAERGADYLDGGIMAIPPMIGTPAALLLYSGSTKAFDAHQRELESLGTGKYLGSDAALAALYDLALLSGMWGMFAGALHAIALVGTEKVEAREFMSLLIPWIHAMTGGLPQLAEQIDTGDYTRRRLEPRHAGGGLRQPDRSQQGPRHWHRADRSRARPHEPGGVAAGYGTADLSSLVELIKKPSDRPA